MFQWLPVNIIKSFNSWGVQSLCVKVKKLTQLAQEDNPTIKKPDGHPSSSQANLLFFICKHFTTFFKEMCEKLVCPG